MRYNLYWEAAFYYPDPLAAPDLPLPAGMVQALPPALQTDAGKCRPPRNRRQSPAKGPSGQRTGIAKTDQPAARAQLVFIFSSEGFTLFLPA